MIVILVSCYWWRAGLVVRIYWHFEFIGRLRYSLGQQPMSRRVCKQDRASYIRAEVWIPRLHCQQLRIRPHAGVLRCIKTYSWLVSVRQTSMSYNGKTPTSPHAFAAMLRQIIR